MFPFKAEFLSFLTLRFVVIPDKKFPLSKDFTSSCTYFHKIGIKKSLVPKKLRLKVNKFFISKNPVLKTRQTLKI